MSDRIPRALTPAHRLLHRHPSSPPELSMDPRAAAAAAAARPPEESVVRSAIYRNGHRIESPDGLAETYQCLREEAEAMAWIGLYRPAEPQLLAVAEEFGLHKLAVEDAIVAHQRPKLERYGETLFVVLRGRPLPRPPRRRRGGRLR